MARERANLSAGEDILGHPRLVTYVAPAGIKNYHRFGLSSGASAKYTHDSVIFLKVSIILGLLRFDVDPLFRCTWCYHDLPLDSFHSADESQTKKVCSDGC